MDILRGSTNWHQLSGLLAFWCRGSERSPPDDILVRGRRSEWLPGHWRRTDISPLTSLGMGTAARGNPRTHSPRAVRGVNPWTSPSGSRTAFPCSGLARLSTQSVEPLGKVYLPPGGTLVSPAGSHNLVGAVSIGQAMLVANRPFLERAIREIGPPPDLKAGLFFLLIYLNYDLGGVWAL